jgi:hypothetical protein
LDPVGRQLRVLAKSYKKFLQKGGMQVMTQVILRIVLLIPIVIILLHTAVRIVRFFYKFPMPQFFANIIDNPLRRAIQPPRETAIRHGLKNGMRVLEVGPGNGRYTIAAAQVLGSHGRIVTIDIEKKMIDRQYILLYLEI